MIEIEIQSDVPMPKLPAHAKYPWVKMQVGDSFFVPGQTSQNFGGTLDNARKSTGRKFTVRKVDGGIRVWRLE